MSATANVSDSDASDRLFVEMSHKLEALTASVNDLQKRLDASQQAINDRLATGLGKIDGRLDELRHRTDVLDADRAARTPVQTAAAPPKATPATPPSTAKDTGVDKPHALTKATSQEAPPPPRPHYTVQAGAPDIAILTDAQGRPTRVLPGSSLEGWGTVLSVVQTGSGWAVKTEHGTIR
ncbi:hypothetical protein K2X14_14170 [Acetobacter sp. TBRC 12305]|uniref:Uncharacterized protein n=1 Tax=Acetobacter garciniae TaxID=2817435 RepID=A0A939HMH2_9PROT|nr:hypothetical protein [Acetobacter garciniae]MBO1326282.1 hypothetical protein [Acetobacter garciniae]MBX0345980.1 hypothetical protein [Acetobacter garciniae]